MSRRLKEVRLDAQIDQNNKTLQHRDSHDPVREFVFTP